MLRNLLTLTAAALLAASTGCAVCESYFDYDYPAYGGCCNWHADDYCRAGSAFCRDVGPGGYVRESPQSAVPQDSGRQDVSPTPAPRDPSNRITPSTPAPSQPSNGTTPSTDLDPPQPFPAPEATDPPLPF